MKRTLLTRLGTAVLGSALLSLSAHAQAVLFSDDFDTNTQANWSVFEGSGNATPDYTAEFAFDYGATKWTYADPVTGVVTTNTIPAAPHSTGGTTKGLKLTANKNDAVAATAAVAVYPKSQNFSGNHALRADLWLNYNGNAFGGTGSTEFGTFGLLHTGTRVNWADASLTDSDGVWFAVTGEGGASRDYRAYEGSPGAPPAELLGFDAGFLDRNADGLTEFETNPAQNPAAPLWQMFPRPPFESPGAPGKQWVRVEVSLRDGILTWKLNGFVLAERPNSSAFTAGTLMLGTMDIFSSIADPKADNFVIFDNVQVLNLDATPPVPTVKVEATDPDAAEPGTDTGTFTFTRTGGDRAQALTVRFRVSGTAEPGVDYDALPTSITFPPNTDTVALTVKPRDDFKGEPDETIVVALEGTRDSTYEVREGLSATVTLKDDGDTTSVQVVATDPHAYEPNPEDTLSFEIFRLGDTTADLPVSFTLGGTAVNGTDYDSVPVSTVIPASATNILVTLTPRDNTRVDGERTVVLALAAGQGYVLGAATNATATIRDDERADAAVLFADTFDTDTSAAWQIRFGAANGIDDYSAQFAYDYTADSIPPAPRSQGGTTKGLKFQVNKKDTQASAAAVNAYPKDKTFNGNYALRVDMFLAFDPSAAGTTEHAIFGLNHSGTFTNRHGAAGSDGLWFAVETDGSASGGGRSYVDYVGNPTAAPAFTAQPAGTFARVFKNPPFAANGAAAGHWVAVEVTQVGNLITWLIDSYPIAQRTNTSAYTAGNVMLGMMDTFNSIGGAGNMVVFDNLRVVKLPGEAPKPEIHLARDNADVVLTFVGMLQAADEVTGAWNDVAGATSPHRVPLSAAARKFWRAKGN